MIIDLTGQKFNRLTAIKYLGESKWLCKCDCGNFTVVRSYKLRHGHTKSCGCLNKEQQQTNFQKMIQINKLKHPRYKHGQANTRLYHIWKGARQRCFNFKNPAFKDYGGRGITFCTEWNNFDVFYNWAINNGYQDHLTIERIDVNGNYCPENCTWIPFAEQSKNRRCVIKSK